MYWIFKTYFSTRFFLFCWRVNNLCPSRVTLTVSPFSVIVLNIKWETPKLTGYVCLGNSEFRRLSSLLRLTWSLVERVLRQLFDIRRDVMSMHPNGILSLNFAFKMMSLLIIRVILIWKLQSSCKSIFCHCGCFIKHHMTYTSNKSDIFVINITSIYLHVLKTGNHNEKISNCMQTQSAIIILLM